MTRHAIHLDDTGETFLCDEARPVLLGMEALGRRGIPVGCRGGGCGVCKVQVLSGQYVARVMSRTHVSAEDEAAGRVLACRIRPMTALRLRVLGPMRVQPEAGAGPDQSVDH